MRLVEAGPDGAFDITDLPRPFRFQTDDRLWGSAFRAEYLLGLSVTRPEAFGGVSVA